MTKNMYPIRFVARSTGLTPHVIRAWENRYEAVKPSRTPTNRRLYSDNDISRLLLLREAVENGHSISQVAALSTDALLALTKQPKTAMLETPSKDDVKPCDPPAQPYCEAFLAALVALDSELMEKTLNQAAVALTRPLLLEQMIAPLLHQIGALWAEGKLKIVQEHIGTAIIRSFLWDMLRSSMVSKRPPTIAVTTPIGQAHELGALIIGVAAQESGWRSIYLGPNLPAEEIAAAVEKLGTQAVALSIVYPLDDRRLDRDLEKLRRCLADGTPIIVGGRAAIAYREVLERIGAQLLSDTKSLRSALASLPAIKKPE